MALTFADYKSMVSHSLHGGDPNAVYTDASTTKGQIVNEAGAYMFASHNWAFLRRPVLTLNSDPGKSHLELPQDFKKLLSIRPTDSLDNGMHRTTLDTLQDLRATSSFNSQDEFWYAMAFPSQANTAETAPKPRLEMFPTPSATESFDVLYRAGWITLTSETQVPNIPPGHEWEGLLSRFVRAFADNQDDNVFDALDGILASGFFGICVASDSQTDWNHGLWSGGVGQAIGDRTTFTQQIVGDPS